MSHYLVVSLHNLVFLVILAPGAILLPVSNNTCIQELHNIHVDAHTIEIYRKKYCMNIMCICIVHISSYIYICLFVLTFLWMILICTSRICIIDSIQRAQKNGNIRCHTSLHPTWSFGIWARWPWLGDPSDMKRW